jgi:hypothetical protein
MPKGIFNRTNYHREISKLNGKKRLGKSPINLKLKEGFEKGDFRIIERITPIGEGHNGKIIFQCLCLECGELREISAGNFHAGDKLTCSQKKLPSNWKGYKLISGAYWDRIQKQAESRGLLFNVTKEEVWNLYEEQNKKCALTGFDITFSKMKSGNTASLDRKDSKKDYVIENLQWVHKDVNMMNRDLEESYFLKICEAVFQSHKTV